MAQRNRPTLQDYFQGFRSSRGAVTSYMIARERMSRTMPVRDRAAIRMFDRFHPEYREMFAEQDAREEAKEAEREAFQCQSDDYANSVPRGM